MRILFAALATLLTLSGAAHAGDIAVYAGKFSALRDEANESALVGLEYRFNNPGYQGVWNGIRPTIGTSANTDGATFTYAGIYWDFPITKGAKSGFVITPGFAPGYYNDNGNESKRLGYGLEFRSTLEATYKFEGGQRVGAQIAHLSNANIGNKNPGTETVQVVYTHPLSF